MLRWNAKADTSTSLVMWLGAIIAVIICVTWYVRTVYPVNVEIDNIDQDLKELQNEFSQACHSSYYRHEFNPASEEGFLLIRGQNICISGNVQKCNVLVCNTNLNKNISLVQTSTIVIEKKNGLFTIT